MYPNLGDHHLLLCFEQAQDNQFPDVVHSMCATTPSLCCGFHGVISLKRKYAIQVCKQAYMMYERVSIQMQTS